MTSILDHIRIDEIHCVEFIPKIASELNIRSTNSSNIHLINLFYQTQFTTSNIQFPIHRIPMMIKFDIGYRMCWVLNCGLQNILQHSILYQLIEMQHFVSFYAHLILLLLSNQNGN